MYDRGMAKRLKNALVPAPGERNFRERPRKSLDKLVYGVHFATDERLAAWYAYNAWYNRDLQDPDFKPIRTRPVVIHVDVSGLRVRPDLDAVEQAKTYLRDTQIREYAAEDLDDARYSDESDFDDFDFLDLARRSNVYNLWAAAQQLFNALSRLPHVFETQEEWDEWRLHGRYRAKHMIGLVEQFKVHEPIPLDRVLRVDVLWPVFPSLGPSPLDNEEIYEELNKTGWAVADYIGIVSDTADMKVLPGPAEMHPDTVVGYHGTTSEVLERAFPGAFQTRFRPLPRVDEVQAILDKAPW